LLADDIHRVAPEELAADLDPGILMLVDNRIKDVRAGLLFFLLFLKGAVDDFFNSQWLVARPRDYCDQAHFRTGLFCHGDGMISSPVAPFAAINGNQI